MEEKHRKVLQDNRVYLIKNIDMKSLIDHLIGLLTPEMEERIMSETIQRDKTVAFLDILTKRGPAAFSRFLEALTSAGFDFVRQKLEDDLGPTTSSVQETTGGACATKAKASAPDWLTTLEPTVLDSVVTEKAMTMVSDVVANVIHVGKIMGFPQGKLQAYQSEHPYCVANQASCMFSDWRAVNSERATVAEFVRLLREAGIDDNKLKDVFMKEYSSPSDRKPTFV